MIVTRRRRKPIRWKRILTPVIVLGVVVWAVTWAPSRNWLATGPTAPLWRATQGIWAPVARPFDSVAQMQTIAAQKSEIAALRGQLSQVQAQGAKQAQKISSLTSALNAAQTQAAMARGSAPLHKSAPDLANAASAANPSGLTAPAPGSVQEADMKRAAAVWTDMDSESAAKIVQRLPIDYVMQVFAMMSPDSVGAILENLPPKYAAKLTQEQISPHS